MLVLVVAYGCMESLADISEPQVPPKGQKDH